RPASTSSSTSSAAAAPVVTKRATRSSRRAVRPRRRAVAVTEAEAIRLISDTVPRRGARNGHVSPRQVGAGVARAGAAVARAGAAVARAGHDAARAGPPSALRRRDGPPCAALGGGAGARTYTSYDAGAAGRLALHALPGPRAGLAVRRAARGGAGGQPDRGRRPARDGAAPGPRRGRRRRGCHAGARGAVRRRAAGPRAAPLCARAPRPERPRPRRDGRRGAVPERPRGASARGVRDGAARTPLRGDHARRVAPRPRLPGLEQRAPPDL